jgi:Luciferase-like monooxygenase
MQFGITIEGGDIHALPELAAEAEQAGWDAIFIPDALAIEAKGFPAFPWFDPWVMLAAMACRTERIRLGTLITAVPRRRPWKLARETTTLDHLSNGRLILAVGLGAAEHDGGFYKVGEAMDLKTRAELLDEGLEIIAGLWSGKPVNFSGEHYKVDKMTQLPTPVQSPRIPVWVVGVWPKRKSMDRALRWDAVIPQKYKASPSEMWVSPEEVRSIKDYVDRERKQKDPFDIIVGPPPGKGRKKDTQVIRELEDAGGTWWLESDWGADAKKLRSRIRKGPPRVE